MKFLITDILANNQEVHATFDHQGRVHINLKKEGISITHCFHLNILLHDAEVNKMCVVIDNAGRSPFSKGWVNYCPFISSNNSDWTKLDAGIFVEDAFIFEFNITGSNFFLSWYPPYPIEKYNKWLSEVRKNERLQVSTTASGTDFISYGERNKPLILFVSRQHPGESMTSFFVEGLIHAFSVQNLKVDKSPYSYVVFPLLNISGVQVGNHRLNSEGADVNRSWNKTISAEISDVKWVLKQYPKVNAIIDIHGDESSSMNYMYFKKSSEAFQNDFIKNLGVIDPNILFLPKQPFLKKFVKQLIYHRKILSNTGWTLSDFGENELHTLSFTLEISAKSALPEDCHRIGEEILNALIEIR
jgi:hypothetical protein